MTTQPSFSILQPRDLTFGRGCAGDAVSKVLALGSRVLLVRGRSALWCDVFAADLRRSGADITQVYGTREPHLTDVTDAVEIARAARCDVIAGVGGGSVIDLAKAIAALVPAPHPAQDYVTGGRPLDAPPLPFIAIPTTAGTGAEVTRNAVICVPERRQKISLRDTAMIADVALVDPALTDDTPLNVTFGSGLDALVQVIEPYLSNRANAYTDALCRHAIPLGVHALAKLAQGENAQARDDLALVSLFGGLALTNAGLGAVHGLAGVIGGRVPDVPHGLLCGRLLCATLQVNMEQRRSQGLDQDRHNEVLSWLAEITPTRQGDLAQIARVLNDWGVPKLAFLTDLPEAEVPAITSDALTSSSMGANGTPLTQSDLARILTLSAAFQEV
ncbi:iron-containing alcohol dehydrogenase [Jannaschia sp. CCS1]|uniref:iron-containing alcohol dehydrogenase n=1 Tax=Jannaschia sp. (strain CCS1) TaxID=290400 RepID=UPI000053AFCF|nr:iron-containing alcohol dehydrogenase [Jannaschia sp. CCS1]ABD57014.1 iron-containing alcohol dehydrogenase [Jannaschia sp. CCS1]